jgi:hypothetical protein
MPTANGWTAGIDKYDRAFFMEFQDTGRSWMLDIPAGKLVRLRGVPEYTSPGIRYVTGDGFGLDRGAFDQDHQTGTTELGSISRDGVFVSRGEVPIGWSSFSPDFTRVVQETRDGWWVQNADDLSNHVTVQLPLTGKPSLNPVWESNDSLLFTFFPDAPWGDTFHQANDGDVPSTGSYILRCSATTGDCEIALRPGYAGDMQGPMYR